ncbi:MAG: hypothetical protein JXA30_11140 [Deltaproteobacteria bacterium]|nr:hypothetical protein [Deltaproteobacteria bacterium]
MKKIKAVEGDARSEGRETLQDLRDNGINDHLWTFVAGLTNSVDEFRRSKPATTAKDVMDLVMLIQHFKMLKEIGISSRINTTLIAHSPDNLSALTEQNRNAATGADQNAKARDSAMEPVTALTNATSDESRAHGQSHIRGLARNIKGNISQKFRGTDDHRE